MDYCTYVCWKKIEYSYCGRVEYSKLKTGVDFIDQTWTGLD